jgi:hypothetical protein
MTTMHYLLSASPLRGSSLVLTLLNPHPPLSLAKGEAGILQFA